MHLVQMQPTLRHTIPDFIIHHRMSFGWTQCEGDPMEEIHAGDVIVCPARHRQWHGATPTAMTHVAIQEALDGKMVD